MNNERHGTKLQNYMLSMHIPLHKLKLFFQNKSVFTKFYLFLRQNSANAVIYLRKNINVTLFPCTQAQENHHLLYCVLLFQLIPEIVLLVTASCTGLYYRHMTEGAHRRTFVGTRTCIESRVKLECEKEQQEQLLLSVIPAYIAAEVSC